jgi:Glycosyltransferase family 87/WD40-like Beta Propeller Repeat
VIPSAWRAVQSDFPNYYVAARLTREGVDTSQIYDWIWIQRQKDHLGIDQPVIGTATLTPFSFLVAIPISYFEPLTAKRVWTIANLLFLFASAWLLHSLTAMRWRHLALLLLLWFPAHQNLRLGQMYLLLLLIITAALWSFLRGHQRWAGLLLGIGFGLKIFPLLFFLYFLRKKQWTALSGLAIGCALTILLSLSVYGYRLNAEYAKQQIPAALRGESLDPYDLARSSPSALLHRLFIYEPSWNPKPALNLPILYAILHPIFQLLIFAPAVLLVSPTDRRPEQIKLEWAAFVLALLVTSTNPASYQFTVLLLPAILILTDSGLRRNSLLGGMFLLSLAGACYPLWLTAGYNGWQVPLGVPRLYFLLPLCVIAFLLLYRGWDPAYRRDFIAWSIILTAGCTVSIYASWQHQKNLYDDYKYRVDVRPEPLLNRSPISNGTALYSIQMLKDGYAVRDSSGATSLYRTAPHDELSFASRQNGLIVEDSALRSMLMSEPENIPLVSDAFNPVLSPDGTTLAFLRGSKGRGVPFLKDLQTGLETRALVPPDVDVLDITFKQDGTLLVAGRMSGLTRLLELTSEGRTNQLTEGPDRYPAVSPDGKWLAFSRSNGKVWNLWLHDMQTGAERRISDVDCNQITPSWSSDSKSLLYASDCGRGLFLTALEKRRVIP